MIRIIVLLSVLFAPLRQDKVIHVLFVGNSLTYTNNLPSIVRTMAKEKGVKLQIKTLAFPDYALEDHWNDGHLQKFINSGKFDFVIVQQGPSSMQEGRLMLYEFGKKIKTLCDENNTTLGFFMVWPARVNYSTFDGVIKNYSETATQLEALLFPVGERWKIHFDTTQDFSYYGADGFHPSVQGSKVAAAVITQGLEAAINN